MAKYLRHSYMGPENIGFLKQQNSMRIFNASKTVLYRVLLLLLSGGFVCLLTYTSFYLTFYINDESCGLLTDTLPSKKLCGRSI